MKKGFYIRAKDKDIVLNINVEDFKAFMDSLSNTNGWLRFKIYERSEPDEKGFTHNMEAIQYTKKDGI